jgi:hypothetical protein
MYNTYIYIILNGTNEKFNEHLQYLIEEIARTFYKLIFSHHNSLDFQESIFSKVLSPSIITKHAPPPLNIHILSSS